MYIFVTDTHRYSPAHSVSYHTSKFMARFRATVLKFLTNGTIIIQIIILILVIEIKIPWLNHREQAFLTKLYKRIQFISLKCYINPVTLSCTPHTMPISSSKIKETNKKPKTITACYFQQLFLIRSQIFVYRCTAHVGRSPILPPIPSPSKVG